MIQNPTVYGIKNSKKRKANFNVSAITEPNMAIKGPRLLNPRHDLISLSQIKIRPIAYV